jgi:hypothetical protein
MSNHRAIKLFSIVASALLASSTLLSCSSETASGIPETSQQQQLAAMPPAFREVLADEPAEDRQAFFESSAADQQAVIAEWERREKMMDRFTPAEKTIISTLSQNDTDAFAALPEGNEDSQEQFLADTETRYLNALDDCLVSTHRRFGPGTNLKLEAPALDGFTPPEQAVIKHLTEEESKQLLSLPKDQREQFLTDAVSRKVDLLLSCTTHSARHSEQRQPDDSQ